MLQTYIYLCKHLCVATILMFIWQVSCSVYVRLMGKPLVQIYINTFFCQQVCIYQQVCLLFSTKYVSIWDLDRSLYLVFLLFWVYFYVMWSMECGLGKMYEKHSSRKFFSLETREDWFDLNLLLNLCAWEVWMFLSTLWCDSLIRLCFACAGAFLSRRGRITVTANKKLRCLKIGL